MQKSFHWPRKGSLNVLESIDLCTLVTDLKDSLMTLSEQSSLQLRFFPITACSKTSLFWSKGNCNIKSETAVLTFRRWSRTIRGFIVVIAQVSKLDHGKILSWKPQICWTKIKPLWRKLSPHPQERKIERIDKYVFLSGRIRKEPALFTLY